jgi:NAD(P)H-flavin reductase
MSREHVDAPPLVPRQAVVAGVERETPDVVTLTLKEQAGDECAFVPGQFNMLYAFGLGEVAISISGDPAQPGVIVHTVRAVGAVTEAICRLGQDDVIGVRGPYGTPWPLDRVRGSDLVMVAGGLGLAPLRPAVQHVLAHRSEYGRVSLLVGARSPEHLPFARDLQRWQGRDDLDVLVAVDQAPAGWMGRVGVAPALLADVPALEKAAVFVCGPELMMRFTVRELTRRGVPADRISLSMERNMKCAVGFCGRCQLGPAFVCKDGPVLGYDRIQPLFWLPEM